MLVLAVALFACGSTGAGSLLPSTPPPSLAVPNSPLTQRATPSVVATTTLASCGAARDVRALTPIHSFSVSPDDLAIDARGRLWVTARQANQLIGLSGTGASVSTQTVSGGPEGVASSGSTLYVAQQDLNAIVAVTAPAHTVVTFPNHSAHAGIDGIAVDTIGERLLVPDSPTGQLFAVSLTAVAGPRLLASGLGRPVAATTDPSGNVFVASEASPGLTELSPSGARRSVGHFADLDEVVYHAGLLYVTELDHRDVLAVDPSTGAAVPVAVNLPAPQGLAVTSAGTLDIVDATTNRLYSTPACGRSS
ncbi:MAG: hypothetical protein DLM65_01695 [Candidatus Aeolococcus gillhamiae]|uniref:SMP-30/Gluconolactonase/LRE-like region domain-containing protein n=1 Tax=Candidatus Aeolococcus gillhamiae TaxID=3127015 RepID=A0A2W5ZDJ1_9BACT|nr:MAG: hypothetical protein DLM65_01695 [Candidatus Dormibacter sp. RRmetagenome_bin12]